jgi:hypothetical protein
VTGLPGLPVGVAGLGPAGASPCLEAPGGDSTDWQHSRHESLSTVHYAEVGDIQQGLGLPGKVSL